MKCSYSQRVFAAVRNVVNPRHVCRGFEGNGQSEVFKLESTHHSSKTQEIVFSAELQYARSRQSSLQTKYKM